MDMRQDALLGAAEVILFLNQLAKRVPGAPTVGTVGNINVFPNSRNIIPEKVIFTVDLRDMDQMRRNEYERELRDKIQSIAVEHQLSFDIQVDTNSEPRYCAKWIKEIIRSQSKEMGLDIPELMGGPFQDALALSYVCDYGMIFVRCKNGISHNPAEFASYDDLALGTDLLYRTIVEITAP